MVATVEQLAAQFEQHHAEVKEILKEAKGVQNEVNAQLFDMAQKMARRPGGGPDRPETWGEAVARSDGYKSLANTQNGKVRIALETKSTITTGSTSGGALAPADRKPDPFALPRRKVTVRDLITPGRTNSTAVEFARQTTRTNAAAMQASEGALKPEGALAWETVSVPVRTLATVLPASKQVLDDSAVLQSIIDGELRFMLADVEEQQLLLGDGTGANLHGIYTQAASFVPPFTLANPTMLDVLLLAITQTQAAGYEADGIVLNPLDWAKILTIKDAANVYMGYGPYFTDNVKRLWSLPVAQTTAMTEGKFLITTKAAAQIFDRQESTVEISTEHSDFWTRNLVMFRAEERLALVVKAPQGFTKGDFAAAITAAKAA